MSRAKAQRLPSSEKITSFFADLSKGVVLRGRES